MTLSVSSAKKLYDQDFYRWIEATVNQIKTHKLEQIDWENLIEELESMGKSQKNSILSNLRILLMYLLKWKYQPNKRSNSWDFTIIEHRNRIEDLLKDSPSLRGYLLGSLDESYTKAKRFAVQETGLPLATFPDDCPFTPEEILNPDYLPE